MTVKDLIECLERYPRDMKVVTTMYSVMGNIEIPRVVRVFEKETNPTTYEEFYPIQWENPNFTANRPDVFEVLYFEGN